MMTLLLVLPTTGIDFAITQYFYTPGVGFAGKHSYLLENILHERAKQAVIIGSQPSLHAGAKVCADRRARTWRCDGRSAVRCTLFFFFVFRFYRCARGGLCVCTRGCGVCHSKQRVQKKR